MLRMADQLGLLQAASWFPLGNGRILIPLDWPSRIYLPDRLSTYEPEAIAHFTREIDGLANDAVLIDCGADIGVFSRLVLRSTQKVHALILYEPNPKSHAILSRNFEDFSLPVSAINAGVSDFVGCAVLENAEENSHAGFIRPSEAGIPVTTIDSLELHAGISLALKIDVEGEEFAVLRGAARTINRSHDFIIQFEAAKVVTERTGQEPMEMLRFLHQLRPCRFTCFEEGSPQHHQVDLEQPFFAQFPERYRVVDVAARSL